jgi:integrase
MSASDGSRRLYRPLTVQEVHALVKSTLQSTDIIRGLTGASRATLYLLAFDSGLRASQLAALRPDDFDLQGKPPNVTLSPLRGDSEPLVRFLAPEVATMVGALLLGTPARRHIWPVSSGNTAKMLAKDLEAASIPRVTENPSGRLVVVFESLRLAFIQGRMFEHLTAIEFTNERDAEGRGLWRCKCDCGPESFCLVASQDLLSGAVGSCGCLR